MPRPRIVTPRSTLACDGIYAHGDIGMRVTLGVNTAFAVKRWPRVEDWSSVVRDELGVSTVQVCLDLVDLRTSATTEREASRHRTALSKPDCRLDLHRGQRLLHQPAFASQPRRQGERTALV
jgi:hypothetical protein